MQEHLAGRIAPAIARATALLLAEAEHGFPGLRHEMTFPRAAGFTATQETQATDVFARATMANLLLDIVPLCKDAVTATAFSSIARREADYVAGAKSRDRVGGWSYFPGLPELPPDVDSLAAAMSLFARIAPRHLPLCGDAVALVLADIGSDGAMETWIVAPGDAAADRQRSEWAIEHCWGRGTDVDVVANFHHALFLVDPDRHAAAIRRGAAKVTAMQRFDGAWDASWYSGFNYGSALCLRLLREAGQGEASAAQAFDFIRRMQRRDGSWGGARPIALETACGIWSLTEIDPAGALPEIARAATALLDLQLDDGSWAASPWIKMQIGRATGSISRVATHGNVPITTALCLKASLLADALLR